jgi:hypothetical protein
LLAGKYPDLSLGSPITEQPLCSKADKSKMLKQICLPAVFLRVARILVWMQTDLVISENTFVPFLNIMRKRKHAF